MTTAFHSTSFELTAIELSAYEAPRVVLRHLKVTGASPAFGFEPCEDLGCTVDAEGRATSCGRIACPACGCSGTNLATFELLDSLARVRVQCTCGHAWLRTPRH
jgi:hypothetical protein